MQVRPVTGIPRARYRVVIRFALWVLRWTFVSIGAVAAASVVFAHIYTVNEETMRPIFRAIQNHAEKFCPTGGKCLRGED